MAQPITATDGPVSVGSFDRLSDAWLACLRAVMCQGKDVSDGDVPLREVLNLSVTGGPCSVEDFIGSGAAPERVDLMVEKYRSLTIVPPYTMSYGALFKAHDGVDQIAWLVGRLRGKPETKSATIGFHVPGADQLSCVSLFDCKVRDGALRATVVYRSQNVFASQPGNIIALLGFQREIAEAIGVETGPLTLHVLSAHIYHEDFPRVEELLGR